MTRQRRRLSVFAALTTGAIPFVVVNSVSAEMAPDNPDCEELAATVGDDPVVIQSSFTTAGGYCQLDFTEAPAIRIRVGLPFNEVDGGSGGSAVGSWDGLVINIGNGGYAGNVPSVGFAISRNAVGSSTDNGHSRDWCNAIDPATGRPNSLPNCGDAGAGFVLDPDANLLGWQVDDFIVDSELAQTEWALRLSDAYYGQPATYNYWDGRSTGGRQGWEMAQSHADLFDGIIAGFPAMNWNRFTVAEAWPAVVVNELLPGAGLAPAKSAAANAAAVAACDGLDGFVDGQLADPRQCDYDATALVCPAGDPATCLTSTEARAINLIWDGPRSSDGDRLWGGIERGTSFNTLLPFGNSMGFLVEPFLKYWVYQDPSYDYRSSLTMDNFDDMMDLTYKKYRKSASTDSTNLNKAINNGTKIITYHGMSDSLIVPFGSFNYNEKLQLRYGVDGAQDFVRFFLFGGTDHTNPSLVAGGSQDVIFDALEDWVVTGNAPDHFDYRARNGDTRRACAYPSMEQSDGSCGPSLLDPAINSLTVLDCPGNRGGNGPKSGLCVVGRPRET